MGFEITVQGRGTQAYIGNLPELRRRLKIWVIKIARICRNEFQRGENCKEGEDASYLQRAPLEYSAECSSAQACFKMTKARERTK